MEQAPKHESAIDAFRADITRLKAEEKETAHFKDKDPKDLIAEDMHIYEAYCNDALALDTFQAYRATIQEKGSRADFAAYLGNMLMIKEWSSYLSSDEKSE